MLWSIYLAVLISAALGAALAAETLEPRVVLFLGVIGIWRYGWGLTHLLRSLVYRVLVFPGMRRRAEAAVAAGTAAMPPELYLVVTSYRIQAETTAAAYRAAIAEAERFGGPVTIIASLVEPGDERFVKALFTALAPSASIQLRLLRLPGLGKRTALAAALRAVSRLMPSPDAAVVVMDGDTVLTPFAVLRCLPLLAAMPEVAALTTDEDAVMQGRPLLREWHRLRFAQRQVLQSSLALGGHLLALTGRMAIFRASLATDPGLIGRIEHDSLDHWRLGHVRFLTGEDKSTWLWLLECGGGMLYVPDVQVLTIEHPPSRSFLGATTALMIRWSGNMLRASGRAVALGPSHLGLFTWWSLVDQRISIWTPLVGPIAILLLAVTTSPSILPAYLVWLMLTRLLQTVALLTVRPRIHAAWPMLLWFSQLWGACVKSWVLFRLDRQQWTRQGITGVRRPGFWRAAGSLYIHGLALTTLVVTVAFVIGALTWPGQTASGGLF